MKDEDQKITAKISQITAQQVSTILKYGNARRSRESDLYQQGKVKSRKLS